MASSGSNWGSRTVTDDGAVVAAVRTADRGSRAAGGRAFTPDATDQRRPAASLVRGGLSLLSTQPVTWTASLLAAVLVPRYLGDEGLGHYAVVITLANLAGLVASLGVPNYLRRQIARQPDRVAGLGSTALALSLVSAFAVAALLLAATALLGHRAPQAAPLTIALLGMIVGAPQTVLFSLFVGQERHARFAWLNAAAATGSTAAGIAVLVLGGDLIAYMVAGLVASGVVTLASWRSAGFRLARAALAPSLLLDLARCGLPFLGWNVALQVYGEVDKLLLGAMAQDAVVGWYAAAYRIISIPGFIPTLIITPLLPVLARCAGDVPLARQTLRQSLVVALVLTVPLCGLIVATAPAIPGLLGWPPPFEHAVPLLQILALHIPLVAVDMVLGTALIALGREHKWLIVGIVAAVFNPALNLLCIPYFEHQAGNGAIGAAVVTVLTELLMLTGALVLMPSGLLERAFLGVSARIGLAAVCLVGVAAAILTLSLPLAVIGGGLAYLSALLALGVVTVDDLGAARRLTRGALGRHSVD